jgi:hypothetical protein
VVWPTTSMALTYPLPQGGLPVLPGSPPTREELEHASIKERVRQSPPGKQRGCASGLTICMLRIAAWLAAALICV